VGEYVGRIGNVSISPAISMVESGWTPPCGRRLQPLDLGEKHALSMLLPETTPVPRKRPGGVASTFAGSRGMLLELNWQLRRKPARLRTSEPRRPPTSGPTRTATSASGRQSRHSPSGRAGYELVDEFYDAAVSGADPIDMRPGFAAMLERIEGNGVRTIIVETASRFAR
jgi:hypothetical protein